ncbi:unnamed protein product [Oreochromis niloticus]|nr:unnamed protein product [Mustela putorius furo]
MENPVCSVANYLFPDGRVIAGHQQALDFLQENSRRLKFMRTKTLPVSGAFHTELMASATEPLREVLRQVESEGKSSLHHELKLKRRIQRENSQRERSGSARSSCSSRGSQSDDLTIHETEKTEKDKQDLEIENIIKVKRLESRLLSKPTCPKKEGALASNEFITKFKIRVDQNRGDDESLEHQLEAANLSDESFEAQTEVNGQI